MKKKLVLNGRQMSLLRKVSYAGFDFFSSVEYFLEENEELPNVESAEIEVEDYEFDDMIQMVNEYFDSDYLEDDEKLDEQEMVELRELVKQLELEEK